MAALDQLLGSCYVANANGLLVGGQAITITLSTAVPVGHTILAYAGWDTFTAGSNSPLALSDSQGNRWQPLSSIFQTPAGAGFSYFAGFYACQPTIPLGIGDVISVGGIPGYPVPHSPVYMGCAAASFTGIATIGPRSVYASNSTGSNTTGSNPTISTVGPAYPGDVTLGFVGFATNPGVSFTQPSGFTSFPTFSNTSFSLSAGFRISTVQGALTYNPTPTPSNAQTGSVMLTAVVQGQPRNPLSMLV